jgi:hypothetical protein
MPKRKDGRRPLGETRDSKAERIHAAAMAIVETDAQRTRAKTERLPRASTTKRKRPTQQS